MNQFDVTIRATVTKTIRVEADDWKQAEELAHGQFTTECDGQERYAEECLDCVEVEPEKHVFSPHTGACIRCGISSEDDAIENGPCFKPAFL